MTEGETEGKSDTRTAEQRAEDVAYTINHAFACTAVDLGSGSPYIGHWISRLGHHHSSAGAWFLGEGVGDFAAVPVTVMVQNHAPGLVGALHRGMESLLGWAFRKSARREARTWARDNALAADTPEAKNKEQQIYRYEIEHLPQVAIWTATSFAFNIATQKLFHAYIHEGHHHGPDDVPPTLLSLAGGIIGSKAFSTGLVVGARATFPDKAHKWDSFAARNVFAPVTRAASKLFGVDPDAVNRLEKRREEIEGSSWEQRLRQDDAVQSAKGRAQ